MWWRLWKCVDATSNGNTGIDSATTILINTIVHSFCLKFCMLNFLRWFRAWMHKNTFCSLPFGSFVVVWHTDHLHLSVDRSEKGNWFSYSHANVTHSCKVYSISWSIDDEEMFLLVVQLINWSNYLCNLGSKWILVYRNYLPKVRPLTDKYTSVSIWRNFTAFARYQTSSEQITFQWSPLSPTPEINVTIVNLTLLIIRMPHVYKLPSSP